MPWTADAMNLAQATPLALAGCVLAALVTVVASSVLHSFGLGNVVGVGVLGFLAGLLVITLTVRGLIDYAALVFTAVYSEAKREAASKAAARQRLDTLIVSQAKRRSTSDSAT